MTPSIDTIMAYESGELNNQEVVQLYSDLIKSGMINSLQGHYGRFAATLIQHGYLDKQGNITIDSI